MVLVAFLLSLLLMNDLLPAFNHMVSAKLTMEYLFSWQVFPLILLFIIILSVIPASYMGHRLHSISETNYRHFFTGRKKTFHCGLIGNHTIHHLHWLDEYIHDYPFTDVSD